MAKRLTSRLTEKHLCEPACVLRGRKHGSVAEIPLVIFTLFLVFAFPMINLGTTALRHGLFMYACRQGAFTAASAYSFGDGTVTKPAAIVCGPAKLNGIAQKFSGIAVKTVDVSILSVDLQTGAIKKFPGKLLEPADTGKFLYFIELSATADIYPITEVKVPFLDVAGLSRKWTTTASVREFVESPQGLDD